MKKLLLGLFLFVLATSLQAHDDLHKRIKEVSIQILLEPYNSALLLKRGELYYQHEEYESALKDFKYCEARNYLSDRLNLNLSKTYRLLNDYDLSNLYVDKILEHTPQHVLALKEKGTIAFEQQKYETAAHYYIQVFEAVDIPTVDNFYAASEAFEQCGSDQCLNKAVSILQKGLSSLGELPVLLKKSVAICLELKDFDRAHSFQDRLIDVANRKERAYFTKAEIYLQQEQMEQARQMVEYSFLSIESLPDRIKNNVATVKFKNQLVELMGAIK